ncbi:protein translocase subunit SecDF [Bacteroidia bacterium]|nr:protein translocase subunit SecDF [Bacteroidia bacterium]
MICLYQLSFTLVTYRVGNKATAYATDAIVDQQVQELAQGDVLRERVIRDSLVENRHQYFVDSVSNTVVYNILVRKYTYKECKEREINLGLDLRGGMNVVMEVSTVDVVRALSSFSTDPMFNEVIDRAVAKNKVTPNSNFVDMFSQAWNEVDKNAQMAAIFSWEMKGITANSSNTEVVTELRNETSGAFERTYQILRQRIDKFGVAQPNIQKLTQTERILIELPGVKEPERVRKLLQGTAQLEFWETVEFRELAPNLMEANTFLASLSAVQVDSATAKDTKSAQKTDQVEGSDDLIASMAGTDSSMTAGQKDNEEMRLQNPLFSVLYPSLGEEDQNRKGPVVGYALKKDISTVDRLLESAKSKFPRNVKFVWSVKPIKAGTDLYFQLVALRISTRDGRAPITGEVVVDARQDYDQYGGVDISMTMNSEGAKLWKNMTGANVNRAIAIVLDNYAYSWPNVNGEIPGGRSSITGGFTVDEGKDLANVLKAGKLPAPARIVQEAVVGPSLGQQAINSGFMSFILAFILVLVYMLLFYNKAGIAANVALLVNMFFLFGVLASLGAVLTLPGLAGIVLTLAMAIDANVIIYERIKEELATGKGIRLAITDGYKVSYSAILDGNITTLLTGIVLYIFGTGPIQGFATTLCIGILTSLFTAIFISRLIFEYYLTKGKEVTFTNNVVKDFLQHTRYDILGGRKISYIISGALIVIAIASLSTRGLSLGIDFKGGRTYVVRFDQNVSTEDIRESLAVAFEEAPEVKVYGNSNQVKISTKYRIDETGIDIDNQVETKLYDGLKGFYKDELSAKEFLAEEDGKQLGKMSSELVGPTMAADITRAAIIAVIIALAVMFVYIAFRFKRWQFGVGAVASLTQNTLITMGVFSLFHGVLPFSMEIDQAFIAAILTVIGYSINDTVIIFDRIRENFGLYPKHSLQENMNAAFNSTLSRTFNTSVSTLAVLILIFIFGGEVIRGFIFALLIGVTIGTLSSMFIASPIAHDLIVRSNNKKNTKTK